MNATMSLFSEDHAPAKNVQLQKAIVISTADRKELELLEHAVRALNFTKAHLVFIRHGENKGKAARELNDDLKHVGFMKVAKAAIGVSHDSVTEALAEKGYFIDIFLGRKPGDVDLTAEKIKKKALKTPSIAVRFASICMKCESQIFEKITHITPEQEGKPGEYKYPGAEETRWDSYKGRYNAYVENETCHQCG